MKLAIIGAGMAGLAAARALKQHAPAIELVVYEKSRGFGGRVSTRRRDGFAFDHGAQAIKSPSPAVEKLLTSDLSSAELVQIPLPTWTFDGDGTISEGDAEQNRETSYCYADGNNRLGKLLAEGLHVQRETRLVACHRVEARQWELRDTDDHHIDTVDAILFTPPAPQIAEIITASDFDLHARDALLGELKQGRYRRCLSLALAYDRAITRPFYALVNNDRKHPVSWLALEHVKGPKRCPPNHSLLIAQMVPDWSTEHYETPVEQLTPQITPMVSALLGEDLNAPLWGDLQRWRYALPEAAADFDLLNQLGAPNGLFFAGDYVDKKGRVHLAIERGWQVAELIVQNL